MAQTFHDFEDALWELSNKMALLWNDIFSKTFPGSQSKIIYLLSQKGPLKMSELASKLELTAGAVTTSADHLIKNEYVERKTSATDRRVVLLHLTSHGQATLSKLQLEGREKMRHVFQTFDESQLEYMTTLFQTAITHLDTLVEERK